MFYEIFLLGWLQNKLVCFKEIKPTYNLADGFRKLSHKELLTEFLNGANFRSKLYLKPIFL